tara:strand:+ start:15890 stop:22291 length:6402 start_codon:yes stop_codon:yes gene_type:complete
MEENTFLTGLDKTLAPENLVEVDTEGNALVTPEQVVEEEKATHTLEDRDLISSLVADVEAETADEPDVGMTTNPRYGTTLKNVDYEAYDDYIDRPFSFISDDADDLRAYGQSSGEKWAHGIPKLIGKTGTNILGSTVGLLYGAGSFAMNLFAEESATKSFFDNDFQRGLDGINDWMDDKLPNYYTKEEQDYNILQSMGTANFWANDFTQGLSFIAGAVLSEGLTAGLASSAQVAKATKILKGAVGAKSAKYMGTKATDDILKKFNSTVDSNRMNTGLRTLRQLGTGAMYESGVEARHHYDESFKGLQEAFKETHGRGPSKQEYAALADLATKSANAVFAGNLALVGYGNYMMFPKIFGKGLKSTKAAYANALRNEVVGKGRAYHQLAKEIGKKEVLARNAWRVLKTPLYEGFVEEGGQKLLDVAGQAAATNYYVSKGDPGFIKMAAEMLENTADKFGEVYGSKEGQKEIGIGFLLAAMGLPGRTSVKGKDGKTKKEGTWNGGIWESLQDIKLQNDSVNALKTRLENDPDAMKAFERNFNAMVRDGVIQDAKDFAAIIDSPFAFYNAEEDGVFNYISSRIRAGFESELLEDVKHIRNMSLDQFREAFDYKGISDLNDTELATRREDIATAFEKKITAVKSAFNKIDQSFTTWGEDQRNSMAHALSITEDSIKREENINKTLSDMGLTLDIEVEEDKAKADEREANEEKLRLKNIWNRISSSKKEQIKADNPGAVEKVKRKLNIKELTDPVHLEELYNIILQEKTTLQAELDKIESSNLSKKEKEAQAEVVQKKIDIVLDRFADLSKAIDKGLDPYISASEQQMLDAWEKADPSGFAVGKDEATQLLKDSRKLRARRHKAISMYNQMLALREEGTWSKHGNIVPPPEVLYQQAIQSGKGPNVELDDPKLAKLITRYQGKIIEFEYKNEKGDVSIKRFLVEDTKVESEKDQILRPIPSFETLAILEDLDVLRGELKTLEEEESNEIVGQDILLKQEAIKLLEDQLGSKADNTAPWAAEALLKANGPISIIDQTQIAQELLNATLSKTESKLKNRLTLFTNSLDIFKTKFNETITSLRNYKTMLEQKSELSEDELESIFRKQFELEADLRVLRNDIANTRKEIASVETDLNVLQNFATESKSLKTQEQVNAAIENLFEASYTMKDYASIYKEMLDNPVFQMAKTQKDGRTIIDSEKLNGFKNVINDGTKQIKELLLQYDDSVKPLYTKIEDLEKRLEELKKIIKVTKPTATDPFGKAYKKDQTKPEAAEYEKMAQRLQNSMFDLERLEKAFIQDVDALIANATQATNVAISLNNQMIALQRKLEYFMAPPAVKEKGDDVYTDSSEGQMSVEDLINTINNPKSSNERFAPAISKHYLGKTAGSHVYAIKRLKEIEDTIARNATVSEKLRDTIDLLEKEQLESQLQFFAFTSSKNFSEKSKDSAKYKVIAVSRKSLPADLADQVVFYDETRKNKWFRTADNKTKLKKQDKENILFVVTDKKGKPVLINDKLVYTSMPNDELFENYNTKGGPRVGYRYGKMDLNVKGRQEFTDLDGVTRYSIEDSPPKGKKPTVTGSLTENALDIIERHKARRQNILDSSEPLIMSILGHSTPHVLKKEGETLNRPSRSIQRDVQNINLRPNTSLSNKVTIGGRTMTLKNNMLFIEKQGKLIPVSEQSLTEIDQETLYNLFIKYADQQTRKINKELMPEAAESIDSSDTSSKNILQVIKDLVYFGPNTAKQKTDIANVKSKRFEIKPTKNGFSLYFGEFGEIQMQQLLNRSENTSLHEQLEEFIKNKKYNVNYYTLGKDVEQRAGGKALKDYNEALLNETDRLFSKEGPVKVADPRKALKAWKDANPKPKEEEAQYAPFTEYTVDKNGNVSKIQWSNYTQYLLGDTTGMRDKPRSINEIPLYTLMRDEIKEGDKNFYKGAQFQNTYLLVGTQKMETLSSFLNPKKTKTTTTPLAPKVKKQQAVKPPVAVNSTIVNNKNSINPESYQGTNEETGDTFIITFPFKRLGDEVYLSDFGTISNYTDKDGKPIEDTSGLEWYVNEFGGATDVASRMLAATKSEVDNIANEITNNAYDITPMSFSYLDPNKVGLEATDVEATPFTNNPSGQDEVLPTMENDVEDDQDEDDELCNPF